MDNGASKMNNGASKMDEKTPLLRKESSEYEDPEYVKIKKVDDPAAVQDSTLEAETRTTVAERIRMAEADTNTERTKKREIIRTTWQMREQELADAVCSYEGIADVVAPTNGCAVLHGICLYLCHCLSSFAVQLPLHLLLLAWPVSIAFMGSEYMERCPTDKALPFSMVVAGAWGTLALLVRLVLVFHTKFSSNESLQTWLRNGTRCLEIGFLVALISQFYYYFTLTPSFDPKDENFCNETFYSFTKWIHDLTIVLVCVWIAVYFIRGTRCIMRTT
ncbi:uncharacterized protein CEXT_6131 [Caerostris extrusa]|uniref:Transmembrane protein n=1 Tax=Caerostris extrusa TaxID=172846 RepID=A0AAV4VD39_CAEEX|nr:uncharacterized protein CEXT_6131 [Caerostris extrusa]